ncbi:Tetratricopeptide repeat-containing protein [Ekhidna lutea]|uniref:Tetratricopeptide repeat-containing protein n=1 Tax=Ekhidna lutea TaxID=447679 RepID=A0A239F750_EKHLU|nr:tetratricopeptide repeat protein [Ekhidna lutea]SNS52645.1 Tetratricopeptide repeat-containing protein [Ekhidna lutea]
MTYLFFGLFSIIFGFGEKEVDELHESAYEFLETNPSLAMSLADSALEMSNQISYAKGVANSFFIKAYLYDEKNELDEALLFYLKASNEYDKLKDHDAVKSNMMVIVNIGSILRRNNKYDESIKYYQKGLQLATENSYPKRRMNLYYNIASALHDKGDLALASSYLLKSIELAKTHEYDWMLVKSWNLLGWILKDNGDFDQSRFYYNKIIKFPQAQSEMIAKAYHNKAVTYFLENNYDEAGNLYHKSLSLKQENENPESTFRTTKELARLYIYTEDWSQAEIFALRSEKLYKHIVNQPDAFEVFHLLDTIYYSKGDYQKAQQYSSKYVQESKLFFDKQNTLIRLKDQFKTDLIVAGFEQELRAEEQRAAMLTWIYALLVMSLFTVSLLYIRRIMLKRTIRQAMSALEGELNI